MGKCSTETWAACLLDEAIGGGPGDLGLERTLEDILAASFRIGDIDRARVEVEWLECARVDLPGGVNAYIPLPEVSEITDVSSVSSRSSSVNKSLTLPISTSILAIRSRNVFHLDRRSACFLKHSPFLVTRSRMPLSRTDMTLVVEGM